MDNREDEHRPEDEVTPADTDSDLERSEPLLDSEKSDPTMSDQLGLETSSSADDIEADIDADTEDDANSDASEPGKDWLVDTGLAAAIKPQIEASGQPSDDDEMEDIDTDHLVNVLCDPNQDVKTESPQEPGDKQGHSNTTFFNDDTKTNR